MPTQTQIGNRDLLKIDLPMSDFLLTSNMSCNKKIRYPNYYLLHQKCIMWAGRPFIF